MEATLTGKATLWGLLLDTMFTAQIVGLVQQIVNSPLMFLITFACEICEFYLFIFLHKSSEGDHPKAVVWSACVK